MLSFREWLEEEKRKGKAPDPEEMRLRSLEREVGMLRSRIRLKKAAERQRRDLEALHKAQEAIAKQREKAFAEDGISESEEDV